MDNGNEPATKADLQTIKDYLQALMGKVETLASGIQTLEVRLDQKIETVNQALSEKIELVNQALSQKIETQEVNWDLRFHAFEHRMEQWGFDMEGRTMTTLYRLMDSGNKRLTESEQETAAIKERLAILEDRLLGIERRLDTPPRA